MEAVPVYQIIKLPGRGKVVVAARNVRPGELIDVEDATLHVNQSEIHSRKAVELMYKHSIPSSIFALLFKFKSLPKELQDRVLSLWCDPNSNKVQTMKGLFMRQKSSFSPEDEKLLIKLAIIHSLNGFGDENEASIYTGISTRMSHSCCPNCAKVQSGQSSTVRTTVTVRAGEELTIDYNVDYQDKPIHERRNYLLRSKGFLCKCARCVAIGDDVRQFDCLDKKCPGRHYTCQPTDYIGCEPFLLPCTDCKRVPPPEFESNMFAIELTLPGIVERLERDFGEANRRQLKGDAHTRAMLRHTLDIKYPTWHRHGTSITAAVAQYHAATGDASAVRESCRLMLQPWEHMMQFPNGTTATMYQQCGAYLCFVDPIQGLALCQRAVRMLRLVGHREQPQPAAENILAAVLQHCPSSPQRPSMDHCVFCGESPDAVEMKRKRCGTCRAVLYCSAACQKAHWTIHKGVCRKG